MPTFLLLSALRKIRYRLLNLNQIFDSSEVAIAIYPTVQGQFFFLRLLATHVSISEVDFDARCVWFEEINGEQHTKRLEIVKSSGRSCWNVMFDFLHPAVSMVGFSILPRTSLSASSFSSRFVPFQAGSPERGSAYILQFGKNQQVDKSRSLGKKRHLGKHRHLCKN